MGRYILECGGPGFYGEGFKEEIPDQGRGSYGKGLRRQSFQDVPDSGPGREIMKGPGSSVILFIDDGG
jgi:hypothetical protein